ncbi:MAG: hypothetical protein ACC700_15860 [Anaerolineales bacterium]
MPELTPTEAEFYKAISNRFSGLREILSITKLPDLGDSTGWYSLLSKMKSIQGNPSNDMSFIATHMAKEYLTERFSVDMDAASKAQGAPGLDIDVIAAEGTRIVGEIKTTFPYKSNDLGAQQLSAFRKDFRKLNNSKADHRFFFLTEGRTFDVMKDRKYWTEIPSVRVVLLPSGRELLD